MFGSFNGGPKVGDDVHTTLDPKAQRLARQLVLYAQSRYGATAGSVVAIVPQTGAVKVMYSDPSYNDNDPSACVKTPGCSEFFDADAGRLSAWLDVQARHNHRRARQRQVHPGV